MKKNYIIPSVNIVRMEVSQLLAQSFTIDAGKSGSEALVQENDWDIWGEDE